MEKTRDLFKRIKDIKGTFHAKMGSIKDRSSMDLTKADDIKNRWQEYTEELYKKDRHDSSAALNMPENLENSAVATGLENASFQSNPKVRNCQKVFKLLHNCTHFTRYQINVQNYPS